MKRVLAIVLALAMVICLAACGGSTAMTMGTGGTAGTYYGYGGVLGQYIKNHAGINVTVGTDGAASNNTLDMIESLRFLSLLQKNRSEDATWLTSAHALDLLTRQSADLFGMGSTHGRLVEGYTADIVLIDTRRPHLQPVHDPASTLVLVAKSSDVTTVLVDGAVVVRNGRLTTLDLDGVYDELSARIPALTDRSHGQSIQEYAP